MVAAMIAKARAFAEMLAGSERRRLERLKRDRDRAVNAMARRYFCTDETPEALPHERAAIAAWEAASDAAAQRRGGYGTVNVRVSLLVHPVCPVTARATVQAELSSLHSMVKSLGYSLGPP
jgi:hypothetical protein